MDVKKKMKDAKGFTMSDNTMWVLIVLICTVGAIFGADHGGCAH